RPTVVERLDAEAIAHEMKDPFLSVPQCKSEHSDEAPNGFLEPPFNDRSQHHLGIRVTAKAVPQGPELLAQHAKVENFAVECHDVSTAGRMHGLMPFGREIDDRQPAVPERDAGLCVDPLAIVVRATMAESFRHPSCDHAKHVASRALLLKDAANPTHV